MNREDCMSYEEQFCEARDCGECYCYCYEDEDTVDLTEFSNIMPGQLLDIYLYRVQKTNQSIRLYGEHDRRTLEDMRNEALVKGEIFHRMLGPKVYATKKFREFENEFFDGETDEYLEEEYNGEDIVCMIESFINDHIERENK